MSLAEVGDESGETMTSAAESQQVSAEISTRNKEIADLANAIRELAEATAGSSDQKRLRELSAEVDRLRAEISQARRPAIPSSAPNDPGTKSQSSNAGGTPTATESRIYFQLPAIVGGYTGAKFIGVERPICPDSVHIPGAPLTVSFDLIDQSLLERASPLRITIDKVRAPRDLLQITEVWKTMRAGLNSFSVNPKLEVGIYRLTYGFYLKEQLSEKYPPFYSQMCEFEIKRI